MKLLVLLAALMAAGRACAEAWLPVAPEDLAMTSEPKAPKAPAIFLYRQVDRNDDDSTEVVYARIKVLTEEGRKYGDVEIPYLKNNESIRGIQARTLRPDGTVVEFDGTVYDKQILKARGFKWMAKTFTLPNVDVGSIIEYRYRRAMQQNWVFDSRWLLSEDLFTRHAKFSLRPSPIFTLRWTWPMGLPPGTEIPKKEGSAIRLETRDVPAFVTEDYMPPEDVMKYRVEFIYDDSNAASQSDPAKYWKTFGRERHRRVESFVHDRRTMEQAVAQIVQPQDPPETKLQKLYARAQEMRNLSFERKKSEQESQREKLSDIDGVGELWKRGYGNGVEITWLFLGLARAAGFEASALLVPTRDQYFFNPQLLNATQLNSNAVLVKLEGRDVFLDPGTPFTPFGLLPWHETAVKAMRLDKDGGTWVEMPLPEASASRIERRTTLKLTSSGSLEGKVTVTYTGLEASSRRLEEREEDDTERRRYLEDEIEGDIPSGIDVKLVNSPDWKAAETPLVAEYEIKVPGWAASAGRRSLLPVGLFGGGEKHTFEHSSRVHPVCFDFRYQHKDDIAIELPSGWQVSSVPKARASDLKAVAFSNSAQESGGTLRLQRDLTVNMAFAEAKSYVPLRSFFQLVRAGDEDQVVLGPAATSGQAK